MIVAQNCYFTGVRTLQGRTMRVKHPDIDLKQKDASGKTAIEIAAERRQFGLLPVLRQAMKAAE